MNDLTEQLISALREELTQYGEMLALLDQQQDVVIGRAAEEIFQSIAAIQSQAEVIHQTRQTRDQARMELNRSLKSDPNTPFIELLSRLPAHYQPLLEALVQENNELLARIHQRARQNHILLTRSLELMQQFIASLSPSTETTTYNGQGQRHSRSLAHQSFFEAVG